MQNNINDLVIKQRDCDPNLHRWKTWEPNTPFAPSIDVSLYSSQVQGDLSCKIISEIEERGLGYYDGEEWKTYNIFSWDNSWVRSLSEQIWNTYIKYTSSIEVESYTKDSVWIRGWVVRLDPGQGLKMHSHSLHENTFLSGNISLTDNNTTTDYWIPLFSLYHGMFRYVNNPGSMVLFPSWLQHSVDENTSGKVRYSVAFDMFSHHTMDFIRANRNKSEDIQNTILLSKRFSDL